mmetsp:Transcript_11708/g.20812  ORF Transcript_11708/g.20812 Transcript_11708/m.20812 type:complete len:247 (-) Transcript_11708:713-1453(-)|eukprot:CAMPEP_0119106296 /NCGR_PEP_ID=MMETSP1180-20130426/4028_1 /TAXON_ID=3052 ORGANISM="Chlamydomonas cf sp, Strain CCMP681" /NCGR_SAMPLE_ID=MMETSP1180 /ASSEMBLY_ACC=CAM_ASM_000741 /LENGTH=246 /DNA_ID=CAMNT_0007091601 /DNA_START=289 /DNA_END=1029 /DNA_ORIENTATION=+
MGHWGGEVQVIPISGHPNSNRYTIQNGSPRHALFLVCAALARATGPGRRFNSHLHDGPHADRLLDSSTRRAPLQRLACLFPEVKSLSSGLAHEFMASPENIQNFRHGGLVRCESHLPHARYLPCYDHALPVRPSWVLNQLALLINQPACPESGPYGGALVVADLCSDCLVEQARSEVAWSHSYFLDSHSRLCEGQHVGCHMSSRGLIPRHMHEDDGWVQGQLSICANNSTRLGGCLRLGGCQVLLQ